MNRVEVGQLEVGQVVGFAFKSLIDLLEVKVVEQMHCVTEIQDVNDDTIYLVDNTTLVTIITSKKV